jgi:hypothetical protein
MPTILTAGPLVGVAMAFHSWARRGLGRTGMCDLMKIHMTTRRQVALAREHRATLIAAFVAAPPGTVLIDDHPSGRLFLAVPRELSKRSSIWSRQTA